MPGIVLEGGTFRPIFSAGVMDALLDKDIMFPYCIGVSAGICNGFSYVSRQRERNLNILLNHRNDKRYISRRNFIKCRSLFGLDFVYDEIPNRLYPFDWDTFLQYRGRIVVGVTNAYTGKSEYLDGKTMDRKCMMLRATCAIPIFFPTIEMEKQRYYDGGLADPIPIRKAISDGNERNLIVLTRPKEYRKGYSKENDIVIRLLRKRYPKLVEVIRKRHERYNETVDFCNQLEKEGKAVILRPSHALDSMEKDTKVLKQSYRLGYDMALENIEKIRSIL
ncbi:MAG TPA: patatin family protein [Lachnospiraceae bacterium]|nr:patatin family protein [Lachnospiraceae bacterium]HEX3078012.1 patatin family protein [Lachnospiraceae bacterium]